MAARIRIKSQAGFTLVELMATTILIGIVAVTLYGGIHAALKLHARTTDILKVHRFTNNISRKLNTDLANIIKNENDDFIFEPDRLTFNTLRAEEDSAGYTYIRTSQVSYKAFSGKGQLGRLLRVAVYDENRADESEYILPPGYMVRLLLEEKTSGELLLFGAEDNGDIIPPAPWVRVQILKSAQVLDSTYVVYEQTFFSE